MHVKPCILRAWFTKRGNLLPLPAFFNVIAHSFWALNILNMCSNYLEVGHRPWALVLEAKQLCQVNQPKKTLNVIFYFRT